MDLQTIQTIVFLENNKILLDGLRLQYKRLKMTARPEDLPDALDQFVRRQWGARSQTAPGEAQQGTYRMQDPFTDFYRFIDREAEYHQALLEHYRNQQNDALSETERAPLDRDAAICRWNTDLLRSYAAAETILGNENAHQELPGGYEDLCDTLAALMGSELCYMLHIHRSDLHVLAHSSIPLSKDLMPAETLTWEDFQSIAGRLSRPDTQKTSAAGTVYRFDLRKKAQTSGELSEGAKEGKADGYQEDVFWFSSRRRIPILALRMQLPKSWNADGRDELCLVFQFGPEEENEPLEESIQDGFVSSFDLWRARNVLILRQQLLKIALRDRFVLLTAQKEYRYVKPLASALGEKRPLRILHLTDLHIQKSNCRDILELVQNEYFANAPWIKKGIDLLFITGDVVQGWSNAGELETNYKNALNIIRRIAAILWRRDSKLRADWKKRIVIIPGNHDYASMNELEVIAENGSRATGVGRPSKKEGGPMVKFAYYEEFLCELLDMDINQMNRMGLNEYRKYSAMGLCVVGLNTSVSAGPIRNNKVSLFAPFIQNVRDTHDPREQKQTVWIGHHTARYRPNYSVDRYYSSKIQTQSRMEDLVDRFRKIVVSIDPKTLADLPMDKKREIQKKIDALYRDLAGNNPPLVPEKDPLMADVLFFRQNWLSATNEQCSSICHAIMQETQMEEVDLDFCRRKYRELHEATKPCLMLGGHIHEIHMEPCCYEGDRFYTEGSDAHLNYAILELEPSTHSWRTYQTSRTQGTQITNQNLFCFNKPNGLDLDVLW